MTRDIMFRPQWIVKAKGWYAWTRHIRTAPGRSNYRTRDELTEAQALAWYDEHMPPGGSSSRRTHDSLRTGWSEEARVGDVDLCPTSRNYPPFKAL